MTQHIQFRGKCTTCQKSFDLTDVMVSEAAAIGCAFSPCCNAVATITKVTVKRLRDGGLKISERSTRR